MSFVLHPAVAVAWFFEDQSTPDTDRVLDQVADDGATVPTAWPMEVAGALDVATQRGIIDAVYRDTALVELDLLPIKVERNSADYAWGGALRMAERFSLSLHDAVYLELAHRLNLPIAALCL